MDFKRLSMQKLIPMTSGPTIASLWGTAQHQACRCLQEKREGMQRIRFSLASCKDQCGVANVLRRRKERKLEEKTLEVLKVAVGTRKEQPDVDGAGAVVPCSRLWMSVEALYSASGSKVMSLKLVLVVQVGPAKSVNFCLVGVGGTSFKQYLEHP